MVERDNVKILKLVTSEEVIAEVLPSPNDDSSVVLKNPVVVSLREMGGGKVGLSMPPWINLSTESKFPVAKSHIVTSGEPMADLLDGYIKQHSTIVVPNSGKLVV